MITLGVHSILAAVGLTARIAAALSQDGISANVIAAHHHDYVFLPAERADEALGTLETLAHALNPKLPDRRNLSCTH